MLTGNTQVSTPSPLYKKKTPPQNFRGNGNGAMNIISIYV